MRSRLFFLLVAGLLAASATPRAQQPTLEEIISRVNQAEGTLITNMRNFRPLVEVYIQNLTPDDQLGMVPIQDTYILGRFDWKAGPRLEALSGVKGTARPPIGALKSSDLEYIPDGFAAMASPDWDLLNLARYEFKLVRREFVGEARTYVIDVKPLKDLNDGFAGRIWVEDRGYNIIRFNGINRRIERALFRRKLSFHVDSWRTNVLPGLWLPSYAYCEESELKEAGLVGKKTRFKSYVRMWGYDPQKAQGNDQFTSIEIAEPSVRDSAGPDGQLSPVLSQRRWEDEAEANVLDRLLKGQLLATPGDVEKVLETVLTNLQVTNDITLDREVGARVLLTSPLESFTVGHTIVLSRGLIDVLPDEASLAMMLAHELAHIVLGHALIDTQFSFADRMMVSDADLLRTLSVRRNAKEETEADAKVVEMLKNSPYKDKLADAGLFLRMLAVRAKQLPNLIQPHIGDHIAADGQMMRLTELMQQSPELSLERLDQVAALSLGARLVLDPWTTRLELLRTATKPTSIREKVPLAVTPLTPYVKYAQIAADTVPAATPVAVPVEPAISQPAVAQAPK